MLIRPRGGEGSRHRRSGGWWLALVALLQLLCCLPPDSRAQGREPDLQLEVFQATRNAARQEFRDEPVRVGLPFPQGAVQVRGERAALSVSGTPFQTRVLKRWPDGSAKWALVEFLASVDRGRKSVVRLVPGDGASPERPLARESDQGISVDTGTLQVEIRKRGFNLFDRVALNGVELVKAGTSRGIVLVDGTGREYLAARDNGVKVTLEHNGPVLATVRVEGTHQGEAGRLLDYTVRLFFCKGKSGVKVHYTLRNANASEVEHAFIRSLDLETRLSLGQSLETSVATPKGPEKVPMPQGALTLYQAVSDFPWYGYGDSFYNKGPIGPDRSRKEKKRAYLQEGYWLRQGKDLLQQGKRGEYADLGWLDLADAAGRGMTAGVRYQAGQWPKALRSYPDGRVEVSLWPEENQQGYWIRYGSHTTFEVLFEFHGPGKSRPEEAMARFQYPLVARAPAAWYNHNVEGIYPLYHFITFKEEEQLARELGVAYRVGKRKPSFRVWRYHYWGEGGFTNQHDFSRVALVNFLRDDRSLDSAGGYALMAEAMANYYADWAVYHSDGFPFGSSGKRLKEHNKEAWLDKVIFEWEHQHWYGMSLYYYLTGDERIREAVLDWGEYLKKESAHLNLTYMRVYGDGMFSLAAMYEFTGDPEYRRLAGLNFRRLLEARPEAPKAPKSIYIDWERGVVLGGVGSGWPNIKADLMLGSSLYDGQLLYQQYLDPGDPLRRENRALLLKISEFMLREAYFEGTKGGKWAYWIPYLYNLADREKSEHQYKLAGQASFWTVFGYQETGEARWLTQMSKMLKMALQDTDGLWGTFGYLDHPGYQNMAYLWTRSKGVTP